MDDEGAGYHIPVMVGEVLEYLEPSRGGLYFDGTVGGGGHSEAILEAGDGARVIGVDQDPEALDVAKRRLERFGGRITLSLANFAAGAEAVAEPLAGALLDLGVSSRHIDVPERGFSFRPGTPLDMRMGGPTSSQATAAELLNELPEAELADIFYTYGEERRSRRLAAEVVRRRRERPFATSDDLVAAMERALGPRLEAQDKARIFQALRIAVNGELSALERALPALRDRLEEGGVLVVLSYHSLEDRMVKDAFREWSRRCICPPELPICTCRGRALGTTLTKKPVLPTGEEVAANPRARSARLRAWSKAA
ncbi:MAG TPA: 16S rRNA (cytosine(1402)-N(4))-methyltransferase RsmH [Longimicrobiales bacterium]|nr:16S rRNA (cytosine(1402)-N(4))-methyltransferase RsmH [Longimicrobiales bacterium]